jgi:heme/copper-type cytochrome/quinol oxidase subunit 4
MGYAAITLALMGFVVGLRFRLKVLLPIVVLLLIGSGIFAVLQGWHFLTTLLAIAAAQTILQLGYFSGILLRWAMSGRWNWRPLF